MIKKEILLKPMKLSSMENVTEPPVTETIECIYELTKDEMNMSSFTPAQRRDWCDYKNRTGGANLYTLDRYGYIRDVPASGWWY